ncbi:hypothetical protein CLAFUW4_02367 [Fulvia fulva]|nr:hypothetical protein CLAFUR4_02362 [Fulvia fulva]KAK4632800.1 hypothetical protein CLAFUR0_02366 [Fulvia fulva]WPV11846.1 hypothetical protein CLAFUW4_02367 [Fulvia fulva]WPV26943.1 hypothetical protein CLAFUW7_02367 [Fulvia fulva]
MKSTMNPWGDEYCVPPSSPDLTAAPDNREEECEKLCREEIESERTFNEKRAAMPQLIDASATDIAKTNERALSNPSPAAGEAFYDASERIDDPKVKKLESELEDCRWLMKEKDESIADLISHLDNCRDTISELKEKEEASANELSFVQKLADKSLENVGTLRDDIEEYRVFVQNREADLAYMGQSVVEKEEKIEGLAAQLSEKSAAYEKLEKTSLAGIKSVLTEAEKARAELIDEHAKTLKEKEDLIRQLAERVKFLVFTNGEKSHLLRGDLARLHADNIKQEGVIDKYRSDIDDLHQKLEARDDTIIKQQKQLEAASEQAKDHGSQVESLQEAITLRDFKIQLFKIENENLDNALACERNIINERNQEIADLQEQSVLDRERDEWSIAVLRRVAFESNNEMHVSEAVRALEAKDFLDRMELLQGVINDKNYKLEQAHRAHKHGVKQFLEHIELLQNNINDKDAALREMRDGRENEAKSALETLKTLKFDIEDKDALLRESRREHKQDTEFHTVKIMTLHRELWSKDQDMENLQKVLLKREEETIKVEVRMLEQSKQQERIIAEKNTELEHTQAEREKEAKEGLERLELITASKDELLQKAHVERETEAKEALKRLQLVIAERANLLNQARLEREEEAEKVEKKLHLLTNIINDETAQLSSANYDLKMTTNENKSLVAEKNAQLVELAKTKKHLLDTIKTMTARYNDRAQLAGIQITELQEELRARKAEITNSLRIIQSLRTSNATLETTLEARNQKFQKAWTLITERHARLCRLNNDMATDAEGWDRVATDEAFTLEQVLEDVDTVAYADTHSVGEEDQDVYSISGFSDDADGSESESESESEDEDELPTYEQSIDADCGGVVIESQEVTGESGHETNHGSTIEPDDVEDLESKEEEGDDWSDVGSQLCAE